MAATCWTALDDLRCDNAQGEYYLTDCPGVLLAQGREVRALTVLKPCEALSINTMDELAARPEAEMTSAGVTQAPKLADCLNEYPCLPDQRIRDDYERPQDLQRPRQPGSGATNLRLPGSADGRGSRSATFPDSEISCKIDEDVRGRDVFLVQPTCPPVNENLMELLIMIDSCKRASAERITAVIPYLRLCPARPQGRRPRADHGQARGQHHHPRRRRSGAGDGPARRPDPGLLRRAGRSPVCRAGAQRLLPRAWASIREDMVVVSPDEGSIKRALGHAERLGGRLAIVDKRRADAEHTKQENIIGASVDGQDRADVRRHDQHGRLDLRAPPKCCTSAAPGKSTWPPRTACCAAPAVERLRGLADSTRWSSPTRFRCRRSR